MESKRLLVLDTETTGLNVDEGDKIIEIGIIELIDDIKTDNSFHKYINPEKEISKSAIEIHGLDSKFLNDKPKFYEIASELKDFIDTSTLIIHNANFDLAFLNSELENCGLSKVQNEIIDTLNIARKEFPGQPVNLDALCRRLNIDNSNRKYHGALKDADLLCGVYLSLTSAKQTVMDLTVQNYLLDKEISIYKEKRSNFSTRNLRSRLTDKEERNHKRFISEIKDNIWEKIKY